MEEIKCPFCNIYSNHMLINESGYTGKKCDKCNTIFISPRPDADEMVNLYKEDNAHISAESLISGNFVARLYARHNLSLIKHYINKGSILEIGACGGYFLDEAKRAGFEVSGIELNNIQAQFIKDKLEIDCETSPLNEASFKGKNFDLIYHCDVISHFYDPINMFNLMNLKLKENGFIVFETGNFGDVEQKYYKYVHRFQYPDHLFFFSKNSVRKLLEETGFDLIKIYSYSILPQLILVMKLEPIINIAKRILTKNVQKENDSRSYSGLYDMHNERDHKFKLRSQLKQFAIYAHGLLFYYLRYKFGSIYFKKGQLQTIIIIAQKRER